MKPIIQARDDCRPMPAHHPGLPPGMRKWDALRLVRKLRRQLDLPRSACDALDKIAAMTAEADWQDPQRLPICYRRQLDMAEEMGLSSRQFRSLERRLEQTGLIERRVASNGWRGSAGGHGQHGVSGLSLAPLIRRAEALAEMAARVEQERQAVAALRIEVRVAWRRIRWRLELAPPELRVAVQASAPPHGSALLALDAASLGLLRDTLETWLAKLAEPPAECNQTSGAAEPRFRRHTEDTTDTNMEICSAQAQHGTAGLKAEDDAETEIDGSEDYLRDRAPAATAHSKPDPVQSVDAGLLRRIASAELRFYLEGLDCQHLEDAKRAVLFRLRELGIDHTAYEAAQEVMGWRRALLAVAIIDRNREHPVTPIRSPGGTLRALTRRHQSGVLDLMASVWGILGRDPAT